MPSINERLRSNPLFKRHEQGAISDEPIQFPGKIMDKITERELMGKEMAINAQGFLRKTGIESLLRHLHEEELNGRGVMLPNINSRYTIHGIAPSLPYSADLSLRWPKGIFSPTLFTLKASVSGDALYSDPECPPINGVLYKTLSLSLDEKESKPFSEQSETLINDYEEHYFDIENPTGREIARVMIWADDTISDLISERKTLRGEKPIF